MNEEKSRRVLFLSVGGSPQPLISSLQAVRPDRVIFVVSDGSDGAVSSRETVDELKARGLCPEQLKVVEVPPDDPDSALARVETRLASELRQGAEVILDYTGGTKSMTSALVLAAAAHEQASLQFMAGERRDLKAVQDGTERPVEIPKMLMGLAQVFVTVRNFVKNYNYSAALALVANTQMQLARNQSKIQPPKSWRRRLDQLQKWLNILDSWDRFDHKRALHTLQAGLGEAAAHAEELRKGGYVERLQELAASQGRPNYQMLEDLWLNAHRKAAQGLYDDAIARLYRLGEAAIQARLFVDHGMDTARVPLDRLPEELRYKYSGNSLQDNGYVKLPLGDARKFLSHLNPQDSLLAKLEDTQRDWQGHRNNSILAHGFKPLGENEWQEAERWFMQRKRAMWEESLGRATAEQLPDRVPYF